MVEYGKKTGMVLFYKDPLESVDLQHLEKIVKGRYSLLKYVELKSKYSEQTNSEEIESIRTNIKTEQIKHGLLISEESQEFILNDRISHFVLKLFVSKSQEESKWWVDTETSLYRYRYKDNVNFEKKVISKLGFEEVREIDFPHINDKNEYPKPKSSKSIQTNAEDSKVYYAVPLSLSSSLITKGYFPIKGKIYVAQKDLITVVCDIFRSGLLLALDEAQKVQVNDERLIRIFAQLKDPNFDSNYKIKPANLRGITLDNLDLIANNHFPPCMKKLYNKLSTEFHLKHMGRLQLGLFLKGVGLSLEDSIEFWRKKFTQKMTNEKFLKNYKYNIEHSYGRLGKMADYSPWGCTKITRMAKPALGEHHGCPFRHSEKSELASLLASYIGLNPEAKKWILERHEREPQVACIRLYENLHPSIRSVNTDKVGILPNAYFDASFACKSS